MRKFHLGSALRSSPAAVSIAILLSVLFAVTTVPRGFSDIMGSTEVARLGQSGIRFGARSLVTTAPSPEVLNSANYEGAKFAVEFAIEPDASGHDYIASVLSYSTGPHFNWAVEQHDTSLYVLHRNRSVGFTSVVNNGQRDHFVFVASPSHAKLFKNGARVGSLSWGRKPAAWATDARLTIGNLDWGDYPWSGSLLLLRVYDRTLGSQDVAKLFADFTAMRQPDDVALKLYVPALGDLQLVSRSGTAVPFEIYPWQRKIKLMDVLLPTKQIVNYRDIMLNFLATLFLGAAYANLWNSRNTLSVIMRSAGIVVLLSVAVEFLQFFSSVRIASLLDVLMNTLGAATGAAVLLFLQRAYPVAIRRG